MLSCTIIKQRQATMNERKDHSAATLFVEVHLRRPNDHLEECRGRIWPPKLVISVRYQPSTCRQPGPNGGHCLVPRRNGRKRTYDVWPPLLACRQPSFDLR